MTSSNHLSNGRVVAEFQATAEDHWLASNWVIKNLRRIDKVKTLVGNLILFVVSIIVVSVYYWIYKSWILSLSIGGVEVPKFWAWILSSMPFIILLLLMFVSAFVARRQANISLKQNFVPQWVTVKVNDRGVLFDGLKRAFFIAFSEIQFVEPLKHGYVIGWGTFASFIPRIGFSSQYEAELFLEMLRSRGVQKVTVES